MTKEPSLVRVGFDPQGKMTLGVSSPPPGYTLTGGRV